jgi:glutaredoxin
MITLYRVANCDACDEVQDALRELVVAHEVIDVTQERARMAELTKMEAGARPSILSTETAEKDALPIVVDGERVISGQTALRDYLAELAAEMEQWRKFQTDACYIDDKGKTC